MIIIDPDDTELKESIYRAERLKEAYKRADNRFNRIEPDPEIYTAMYDFWMKNKQAYEDELINLALLVMERL